LGRPDAFEEELRQSDRICDGVIRFCDDSAHDSAGGITAICPYFVPDGHFELIDVDTRQGVPIDSELSDPPHCDCPVRRRGLRTAALSPISCLR